MSNDDKSLEHTRWNCKYHIVFTPKYRRKVIYGQLRRDIGKILRKLSVGGNLMNLFEHEYLLPVKQKN
ncbi:transposase for insertion sequence element IS200 [Enterococcus sp. AZ194]